MKFFDEIPLLQYQVMVIYIFQEAVGAVETRANIDAPEGGLEALLQVRS